jgi:lipopolysaccharide export system protein LptA
MKQSFLYKNPQGFSMPCGFLMQPCFFFIALLLVFSQPVFSQEKKAIQILSAQELRLVKVNGKEAKMLKGNVQLKQDEVILHCDSAYFYNDVNAVDAFGNVHIKEKDTDIFSDSLKYNGETKIAILYNNVSIVNPEMNLATDLLTYYISEKKGIYTTGATIKTSDKTLTSKIGYYFSESKMAHFRKDVLLVSEKYTLTSDTLIFNTGTEISYFRGPTTIVSKENTIICENGFSDPKNDYSEFGKNTVMFNKEQILKTDSLQYNSVAKTGKTFKYFHWADTTSNIVMQGTHADFFDNGNRVVAPDNAMLVYIINKDSLFVTGDTLKSITDTTTDITTFFCYYKVKFFKSNLQGKCDSLYFSYADSIIRMFNQPILWSEKNQLSGDTIYLYMKNQKIERFEMFENGFMINHLRRDYYNQVKGKKITGYFKDDKLDKIWADYNAESVYYAEDSKKKLIGANQAVGSFMWIYMKDEEVNRIVFHEQPVATFHPIQKISPKELQLKNFKWQPEYRPLKKEDIFLKN